MWPDFNRIRLREDAVASAEVPNELLGAVEHAMEALS
jgi:hypothetical protein